MRGPLRARTQRMHLLPGGDEAWKGRELKGTRVRNGGKVGETLKVWRARPEPLAVRVGRVPRHRPRHRPRRRLPLEHQGKAREDVEAERRQAAAKLCVGGEGYGEGYGGGGG